MVYNEQSQGETMPHILYLLLFLTPFAPLTASPCCCSTLPSRFAEQASMVWIPGGEFYMGAKESLDSDARDDEKPRHKVKVSGFWMDTTPVTNRQFKEFVDATGYVTTAEIAPVAETIMASLPAGTPEVPAEMLVAASLVFTPTQKPNSWWQWKTGANWKHPLGPDSSIVGKEEHPVVHVSYIDAQAYAKWAKKRLPTEAEWEFAAYGGNNDNLFSWGIEEFCEEMPQANIWQGQFPHKSSKPNGSYGTTAVKSYPPNGYGLYDMAGNVWQWCQDAYSPNYYMELSKDTLSVNPQGPLALPSDKSTRYVHRGGSFICHKSYCKGYRITARMCKEMNASLNHLGFRCVSTQAVPA